MSLTLSSLFLNFSLKSNGYGSSQCYYSPILKACAQSHNEPLIDNEWNIPKLVSLYLTICSYFLYDDQSPNRAQ